MNILDDLINKVSEHIGKVIAVPAALSIAEWVANILHAASDGIITNEEMANIIAVSNPIQLMVFGVLVVLFKWKKK